MKKSFLIPALLFFALTFKCFTSECQSYYTLSYVPTEETVNQFDTLFNINLTIHNISSIPACAGIKIQIVKISDGSVVKEFSRNLVSLSNSNNSVLVEKILPSEKRIVVKAINQSGGVINTLNEQ